jgi:hypothetical protein
VGNLIELQDQGAQDLKGIVGPVRAWAALRPSSVSLSTVACDADDVRIGQAVTVIFQGHQQRTAGADVQAGLAIPV